LRQNTALSQPITAGMEPLLARKSTQHFTSVGKKHPRFTVIIYMFPKRFQNRLNQSLFQISIILIRVIIDPLFASLKYKNKTQTIQAVHSKAAIENQLYYPAISLRT